MIRMSTGHMEGNLQLLYVLLTDCYVYLLRKGATPTGGRAPTPFSQHPPLCECPMSSQPATLQDKGVPSRWVERQEGEEASGLTGIGVSSPRGHREAIPGRRGCLLQ